MLFSYIKETQRLLRDQKQTAVNIGDIIDYINRARRAIARRTECVRFLTPISSSITGATITAAGSGYISPTLVISAPDYPSGQPPYPNGAQATGTAHQTAGTISSVSITYGGSGYFQPVLTITDPAGTGATVTPSQTGMTLMNQGQETYYFRDVNLDAVPGVGKIIAVKDIWIIYANYRYRPSYYSLMTYKSFVAQYPFQYQYVPSVWTEMGSGAASSILLYPFPSQTYQMEWDARGQPSDLADDQSYEVIEDPWRDVIPFYAAALAFADLQNYNAVKAMEMTYKDIIGEASRAARPGRANNVYGRY